MNSSVFKLAVTALLLLGATHMVWAEEKPVENICAATSATELKDIGPESKYYDDYQNLVERYGTLTCYGDLTVKPEVPLTRAALVMNLNAGLNRIEELKEAATLYKDKVIPKAPEGVKQTFYTDVKETAPYANALHNLKYRYGITIGENHQFNANTPVTYMQLSQLLGMLQYTNVPQNKKPVARQDFVHYMSQWLDQRSNALAEEVAKPE